VRGYSKLTCGVATTVLTPLRHRAREVDRLLQGRWPVVEPWQDVGMEIDHPME
jgi:hypothetical protein